jgi:hypothetical protein
LTAEIASSEKLLFKLISVKPTSKIPCPTEETSSPAASQPSALHSSATTPKLINRGTTMLFPHSKKEAASYSKETLLPT